MATAYARAHPHGRPDGGERPAPATREEPSLEEIHESVEVPGCRVEILEGRIVVSPSPVNRHGLVVTWLMDALKDVCEKHDLRRNAHSTVELPATRERVEPDLLIYRADEQAMEEWLIPARDAVLVVEVVSPSSRRDDYEVKRRGCALSEVPLYLVVDPETRVATLFSEPSRRGYLAAATVPVGGKLILPDPLEVTLDTATMPVRRDRQD